MPARARSEAGAQTGAALGRLAQPLRALTASMLLGLGASPAGAADAATPVESVRKALAAVCNAPEASPERMAERIPGATGVATKPLVVRGAEVGWQRRFPLADGGAIRVVRFAPGGRLRRLAVERWTTGPDGSGRPAVAGIADGGCTLRLGRRLVYADDAAAPVAVEYLGPGLEGTGERAPLDPPVPDGVDPGGVAVALVDSGVNYRLPAIARRLARDESGAILGYDYWDLDPRPFDTHPARSPFFPERHGTRTASLLLRETPGVRLVPYRYPRPDMSRMRALVADAAEHGVRIVSISMGSDERGDWAAFADAAAAHPQMLFVLSAGNGGRDIDARPVYPAALELDNAIVVTSSTGEGALARGSNWGERSVDLLVPAERLRVTGFDGVPTAASGSSYAAPRIAALAARLLAAHPDWNAARLKDAIFARVLPPFAGASDRVAQGFMPRPDKAEQLPPLSGGGRLRVTRRYTLDRAALARASDDTLRFTFAPTFTFVDGGAWEPDALRRHARRASAILAQCGIGIRRVDVHALRGPEVFRYFHDEIGRELARQLDLPKPVVHFVRDTLQTDAFDAETIGKSNSGSRPTLRYTVWLTSATAEPGLALAHEFAHLLMDSGRHVDEPGNLMAARATSGATALTGQQCRAMVAQGLENGLLERADR